MTATFKIGTKTERLVPVSPQSHARIRVMLPKVFSTEDIAGLRDSFASEQFDVSDLGTTLLGMTGKAYAVLTILAPQIADTMPEHEWQGFGSADALQAGDDAYDPEADNSPHPEQIIDALEVALKVNGLRRLGELLGTAGDAASLLGGPGGPPASGRPTTPTSPA